MIDQEYEASVSDQFVTVDNDALFKCQLAPQVRDFHQVIGWLEDGQQLVSLSSSATPSSPVSVFLASAAVSSKTPADKRRQQQQQQQRAIMLPDGQLYIQRVQLRDANKSYRCQIRNLLNGRLSLSTINGRLFVTGKLYRSSQRRVSFLDQQESMCDFFKSYTCQGARFALISSFATLQTLARDENCHFSHTCSRVHLALRRIRTPS